MSNNECSFATMVLSGAKPDVEVHAAGFNNEGGMGVSMSFSGKAGDVASVVCNMVENHVRMIEKEGGVFNAAIFVQAIGIALAKGGGEDVMKVAALMGVLGSSDDIGKLIEELEVEDEEEDD